ncbi:MAG: PAS domain S-box protein [Desulfobacterales bacterium]|nr:PAS domain S-box protein [Desulfobacterales bacterium]
MQLIANDLPPSEKLINLFVLLLVSSLVVISFLLRRRLKEEVFKLKTAQQELLTQTELLRLSTEANQAGIWDFYPGLGHGYFNEQWYTMLGYPPTIEEIPLAEWAKFIHPDDLKASAQSFKDYINAGGGGHFESEFRIRQADGTWCWMLSKGRAIAWDDTGRPSRIIGLNLNVQKIKEVQESLAQSEARFRAIFENAPFPIIINSLVDGTFLDANRTFLESRGISKQELLELNADHFHLLSERRPCAPLAVLKEKGIVWNIEASSREKDGSLNHFLYSSVLLEIQGLKQIISMTVDMTERKRAEKALKESEARFRTFFKMAPMPLAYVSLDGRIVKINNQLMEMFGYTTADLSTMKDWWQLAFPDGEYRDQMRSIWQETIRPAVESGAAVESGESRVTCKDGTVRTMIVSARVIGENILVSFFDITDRKRAEEEREKLQGQLLQSKKLEAVGTLAGGIAHDFNNMLGAIIGYSELTLRQMDQTDSFRENLGKIHDAALRSAGLTRQLLAFARKQTVAPVVFDLNEAVESILKMLRRLIGENISLTWLPGSGKCTVRMDHSQLDQILANLCVNARDAIADVGKITIETGLFFFDNTCCGLRPGLTPGQYVLLAVSDNGCGMDKQALEHIFEPFFTTKGVGKGTGLGLATVYGIVKQSEGFVSVYSEPDRGSTFKIYLPHHEAEDEETKPANSDITPRSRGETILLVEDDPTLLEMCKRMLRYLGYTVLSAGTPGEAIRIAREHDSEIHLFITDVIMPEMNGRDLADRLVTIRPAIKHVYMSGYTANVIACQGVKDTGLHFLQKPFSLKSLAVKVREVLESSRRADGASLST